MNKQCNINFSKLQLENKLLKEKFGELNIEISPSSVAASAELCEKIKIMSNTILKKTFYEVHLRAVTRLLKSSSTSISFHRMVIH